ncbi:PREDICTED: ubiquitin-like protein 7 [Nicrophorus vespilloides]|uniref:Ubiquitin-like protein 7 n=1 Tax=Nicrophorus vespilloides TaxID=110193 RepID=A0ABM1MVP3_NICVS|nr:PREDICTED: ubiquitin-like protein 7 [Nicrophorus vespilloides]
MTTSIMLGIRLIKNQYERIQLDNIDLEGKVVNLRQLTSEKINREAHEFELIYCGMMLDDNAILSSYGVTTNTTIHVLSRKKYPSAKPIKQLPVSAIKKFAYCVEEAGYRAILQRVAKAEVVKKLLKTCPELEEDQGAIAFLLDHKLLSLMSNVETLNGILQMHPVFNKVIPELLIHIMEESRSHATPSSTASDYALETLTDDDDMDSESTEGNPLSRNSSANAITAAQLAAAIANATTSFSSTGGAGGSSSAAAAAPASGTANASTTPDGSRNLITSEMFGNALANALGPSSNPGNSSVNPGNASVNPGIASVNPGSSSRSPDGEESFENIRTRLRPQLNQMQEMGLVNESQNIRALQATNADLQAAIELVFNGVID